MDDTETATPAGRDPLDRMTPLGKPVRECSREDVLLLANVSRFEAERHLTDAVWYESMADEVAPREPTAKVFIDATRRDDDEDDGGSTGLDHAVTSGLLRVTDDHESRRSQAA
ncbi:MAG: hypothetical protein AAF561_05130 [Planctomycetota bacterium]